MELGIASPKYIAIGPHISYLGTNERANEQNKIPAQQTVCTSPPNKRRHIPINEGLLQNVSSRNWQWQGLGATGFAETQCNPTADFRDGTTGQPPNIVITKKTS